MKILLVSPVSHHYITIPNTSDNLESIYLQLASELNLSFISAKTALDYVAEDFEAPDRYNSEFYLDNIHPNSDGSRRLVNYIFSEIGSTAVYQNMTVTDSPTKTLEEIQINLPINLLEE